MEEYENPLDVIKKDARNAGKKEGKREGIKLGKIEVAKEIAKCCIKEEIDQEIIVRCTGLTLKEIDEI